MPTIDLEIEVWCSCGEGLCNQSTGGSGRRGPHITVEPCEKCLSRARNDGYDEGYEECQKKYEEE